MKPAHDNVLWMSIIALSLIGLFFLIKAAYANPLGLPEYAYMKAGIREAYTFAKIAPEKLEGLPCNCGCMTDAAAHGGRLHARGLIDCFMQGNVNAGGVWDRHALECGLCYEDAMLAKQAYENGKTKGEIREILAATYATQKFGDTTVYGGKRQ